MKHFFISTLFVLYTTCCFAQKPPIDTSIFEKWPSVLGIPAISNNGDYFLYTIYNQPVRSQTLVLRAIKGSWKTELPGVGYAVITDNSRQAVFINSNDSLCLLTLGSSSIDYIPHVGGFQLFRQKNMEWLAYQLNTPEKELVFRNLLTGNKQSFAGVAAYLLSKDGNILVLKKESKKTSIATQSLIWVKLSDGTSKLIWEGGNADNLSVDAAGTQMAFTVVDTTGSKTERSLWYYKAGTDKAVLLANSHSAGISDRLKLDEISGFSKDGSRLFFILKEKDYPTPKPDAVKVDIWSYTDEKLQSQQLNELRSGEGPRSYAAVIDIHSDRITRLQEENEETKTVSFFAETLGNVVQIVHRKGDDTEQHWNPTARSYYYLVSTINGERKQVDMIVGTLANVSPGGKYVLGTDRGARMNYFSYEVATGVIRNITKGLPIPLADSEYDRPGRAPRDLMGVAAWLANDVAALIYDKYDIWQVDPAGIRPPVNITNSYGRRHNIVFRLAEDYSNKAIVKNELILSAFNRNNKNNGFYSMSLDTKKDPKLLTMGPCVYDAPTSRFAPLKARDTVVYVIRRESASHSPNYFSTTDFNTFTPLTAVYPEASYNWLSSGLLTWKALDGRSLQGVLYKPENFDQKKKYPVIINYYEKMSDVLNEYQRPVAITGAINIPWFVSHGYLVFTPDINYAIGMPGQSAYNSVVAAAKYLAQFPWIDSTRMGICGHSFGGYETNYILTHSNIFAAAMSSSGFSNLISAYGAIAKNGAPFFRSWAETGQGRIGANLWQRPDLYIKNSPIFQADKVTTPLLMMNNKGDGIVPFAQGEEFFTALRRLGKKVWMLQYDGEDHSIGTDKAKYDYTIRITQFFDHYLKGAPPPKWMTKGIPAKMKGIDDGLELDDSIQTPGAGLLPDTSGKKLTD